MFSRQTIAQLALGAATFLTATQSFAQAPKVATTTNSGTVPIVPVSLSNEQVAATVNGEKILVGEVRKILDSRPYPLSLTELQKKEMRKAAVESLIEDVLMRQYLAKNVAQVNQGEFNKEVQELIEALKKQNKTMDMFYKESGQTEDQLRRDIVARLQWRTLLARFLPEREAKVYYDANKPYFDKVFVRASHILIKLPEKTTLEQRNKAMQQMLVWRQEILTGKTRFEDIARQYSQCPTKDKKDDKNVPTPGDIGQFTYKFMVVPEFAKAAYALRPGEISDVVQTVFGLHLIKVTERTKAEPSNFEAIKDTVRSVWAQDTELFARVLTEQHKLATVKIQMP